MKKLQGFVDPISLTFILVLGIATAGSIMGQDKVDEQQLTQDTQAELTESADAAHQYLVEN